MGQLGIPKAENSFAMRSGVFDLITIIPMDLLGKGIAFIHNFIMDHIWDLYLDKAQISDLDALNASTENGAHFGMSVSKSESYFPDFTFLPSSILQLSSLF